MNDLTANSLGSLCSELHKPCAMLLKRVDMLTAHLGVCKHKGSRISLSARTVEMNVGRILNVMFFIVSTCIGCTLILPV